MSRLSALKAFLCLPLRGRIAGLGQAEPPFAALLIGEAAAVQICGPVLVRQMHLGCKNSYIALQAISSLENLCPEDHGR